MSEYEFRGLAQSDSGLVAVITGGPDFLGDRDSFMADSDDLSDLLEGQIAPEARAVYNQALGALHDYERNPDAEPLQNIGSDVNNFEVRPCVTLGETPEGNIDTPDVHLLKPGCVS